MLYNRISMCEELRLSSTRRPGHCVQTPLQVHILVIRLVAIARDGIEIVESMLVTEVAESASTWKRLVLWRRRCICTSQPARLGLLRH